MFNWLTSFFSKGTSEVVNSVGQAIDSLVTSDEERLKLKNELRVIMNDHERHLVDAVSRYDEEITKRHEADMKSDSYLAKNIRPLVLAFLTVATIILAYLSIFILPEEKVVLLQPWIDLLKVLLVTTYAFYFGSRGIEKYNRIKMEK